MTEPQATLEDDVIQDVSPPPAPHIANPVKLVIWDLDDTFWTGTLSEGNVTPVPENINLVRRLAARGIVSSICSKNDYARVENQLRGMGVWDDFVLPSVSFQSKGALIARLIEALQLRAENVVFIDDNPTVLAEAAFNCPGLMCLESPRQLIAELDAPPLRGSPDSELKRLAQYRLIARKFDARTGAQSDNVEFLRQSEIYVEIDYDIEPHIERIIELVNRSNQLNYTKKRIETDADRTSFLESLRAFGFNAGIVKVWDRYGDYGIVGFFMTLATLREYKLEHFVFSCRIMNMGVEQYVYDYLKGPDIDIAPPVANPIRSHGEVDWIKDGLGHHDIVRLRQHQFVLIGGCDMLQLSTYCSSRSVEFTNRDERGLIKRLDDPFLILDDPDQVRLSELRPHIPAFNADDMLALRDAVGAADAVVLSLYRMMEINYFRGQDGLVVRFDEDAVRDILRSEQALWFVRNFSFAPYSHEERNDLIRRCLDRLSQMIKPGCKLIVLLENTRKLENNPNEKYLRELYNKFIIEQSKRLESLVYIDINAVTNIAWLFDDGFHMSRKGYHELAQVVRAVVETGRQDLEPMAKLA